MAPKQHDEQPRASYLTFKSLIVIFFCSYFPKFVLSEAVEIYTRTSIPDTALTNVAFLAGSPITPGAKQLTLTLTAFQTVFSVNELGPVEIDLTITSRRSRHILFCLVNKTATPNPSTAPASSRSAADRWQTNCEITDVASTMLLVNRQWLKKPAGDL